MSERVGSSDVHDDTDQLCGSFYRRWNSDGISRSFYTEIPLLIDAWLSWDITSGPM